MEKETNKQIEENARAIIRVAKALKSDYEREKQFFPILHFIVIVSEKEPYKDFSDKSKKKAKELFKFL